MMTKLYPSPGFARGCVRFSGSCLLAFCWLLMSLPSFAQMETATLSGTVMDRSGAVVADAQVQVTNSDTSVTASTITNNSGIYVIPSLKPGRYRIAVSKIGFKQVVVTDVILNVQDVVSRNFNLDVGAISESITVTADQLNVNTTDATVSTVVDRQFAENLPLNSRSFQTLIQLTPGVVVVPTNIVDAGQFSVDGQRATSNYWMVDGASANIGVSSGAVPGNGFGGTLGSFSALGGTNSLVSVDAMQEFRIQTSTYAPEFGRTPGAQISIVTRSGTKEFHGTVFDFLRNDVLDANNWFNGYTNNPPLPKAEERQNDFGGTFSGPIHGDRTFFFFSYEGLRLRLPQTALTTVPDASFTPGGTTNSRQNAVAAMQPFLNAFPLPNRNSPEIFVPCDPSNDPTCPPSGQKATGSAAFNAAYSNAATLDAYSIRIDRTVTKALSVFGRYNNSPSQILGRNAAGFEALSVVTPARINTQTLTIGATWMASSTIASDLRFNYSRVNGSSNSYLDSFGGAVPLSTLPFPASFTENNAALSLNLFALTGSELLVGANADNLQRQFNVIDNLSVQKGSHSLKFGIDFRRLSPQTTPAQYSQVAFFLDMGSAETGSPFSAYVSSATGPTLLFRNLGVFAQDTWRARPRITVTYGLRWDLDFSPSSLAGPKMPAVTGYNLNDLSHLAIAPIGTPPFRTTYGNVAPRLGLAYEVNQAQAWQTVIRGGLGVFYDLVSSETGGIISGLAPPFGAFNSLTGSTFPFSSAERIPPTIPTSASLSFPVAYNPSLRLPYTLEWNVAYEQALGRQQQTISASYVGAVGSRLLQTTAVVSPPTNPNILSGSFIDNTATSDYNALQIQFQRRLSQGAQGLVSYTWSHSIDTGSAGSAQLSSNAGIGANSNANRGPSDFDIRHALSAGLTYSIPELKGHLLARSIFGGWSLQSIIQARSAPPVDVFDANFFGAPFDTGISADLRPDVVPRQPFYLFGTQYPGHKAFNPAAFTNPPADPKTGNPLRQGTLPRNDLRGFGATQWDFAVHRDFPIHDSLKLQFRAEMFNFLNHPNFAPPFNDFGESGFGLSQQMLASSLAGSNSVGAGGFDPMYQIGGPRSIQLALKLMF